MFQISFFYTIPSAASLYGEFLNIKIINLPWTFQNACFNSIKSAVFWYSKHNSFAKFIKTKQSIQKQQRYIYFASQKLSLYIPALSLLETAVNGMLHHQQKKMIDRFCIIVWRFPLEGRPHHFCLPFPPNHILFVPTPYLFLGPTRIQ